MAPYRDNCLDPLTLELDHVVCGVRSVVSLFGAYSVDTAPLVIPEVAFAVELIRGWTLYARYCVLCSPVLVRSRRDGQYPGLVSR